MKNIAAALVAACLIGVPATSFAAPAEAGTAKVSVVGVNFADAGQVAAFRARVDAAIARACNPTTSFSADLAPDRQCQRETAAKLTPTLTRLMQGKSDRAMAAN